MTRKPRAKAPGLVRRIYTASGQEHVPGRLMRSEGTPPTGDAAVDEAYDAIGISHAFFREVFGRNSIDGKGMPIDAVVHYGSNYPNAFWNGRQIIFGDGDGSVFRRFTIVPDVAAKQFANGVVSTSSSLVWWEQSGALMNSIAVIFAVLSKQHAKTQRVSEADWVLARGILQPHVRGTGIASVAEPGTAYDDPDTIGVDPQPAHMRSYVKTSSDSGGVHTNSGIPCKAFYLAAAALGGYAWDRAGRIWYDALCDRSLKSNARFADFARLTLRHAQKRHGTKSDEAMAVRYGWECVGVLKRA
jgi:Zn-dependent metalloprotease